MRLGKLEELAVIDQAEPRIVPETARLEAGLDGGGLGGRIVERDIGDHEAPAEVAERGRAIEPEGA